MRQFIFALVLAANTTAFAAYDDEEVGGYAVVIEERKFDLQHEFTLGAGVLPLDAFFKSITGAFRYTLHFDEFQAWEIVSVSGNFNIQSGLREELALRYELQPDAAGLIAIDGILESNYVVKPVSGKLALFNRTLILGEAFFSVGGATGVFAAENAVFLPGPTLGAGIRFYVADWLHIRTDVRYYALFNGVPLLDPNSTLEQVLFLGLGVSFNFGGRDS